MKRMGCWIVVIKILGTGCPNCLRLERSVVQALKELGVSAQVEKVTDIPSILAYGIVGTPGLVINEKVRASGRVPGTGELTKMIRAALAEA